MANVRKLTRILDKLVQVGPGYLDQTLRSYITENKEYRLYYDKDNQSDPTANTYAVFSYFSSGVYKTEEERETDILIVAGGGGGSVGNIAGGSGGGEVIVIEKAILPAGAYVISVGAGGAGGAPTTDNSVGGQSVSPDAIGGVGNDSYFKKNTDNATVTVKATGGGAGGFRKTDVNADEGGSGGGAGGADSTNFGIGQDYNKGASTISDINLANIISNDYYGGTVTKYGNDGGFSDAYTLTALSDPDDYYNAGGGGGAGAAGETGGDSKAGNGGNGSTFDWVNEVFSKVYKFNGDIYWGSGGGGAAGESKEPGNGGLGGGGGGASYRQLAAGSPETDIFWNGKGGSSGYNPGYDASYMKGGAGGQNTGSGAGGSTAVDTAVGTHIHKTLAQGPNGGSGFVLIRVAMRDLPTP